MAVTIGIEIEIWVCFDCDWVLVFVRVHMGLVAVLVIMVDFGCGSAFCGFWRWVLALGFVGLAVAVGCGYGCYDLWFVVTGGDGAVVLFFFYVVLWLPK